MPYTRPAGVLAGFHTDLPDPAVPELRHVGEQWAPRAFRISDHTHDTWEFYLQAAGETHWEGAGRAYTLAPAAFLAVPPGVRHHLCDPVVARHHFFFAGLDLAAVLSRQPELASLWARAEIVHVPRGEFLLPPFRQLIREVSLDLPRRAAGMRLALDALVVEASRLRDRPQRTASLVAIHPAALRARELLDAGPGHPWRLADLAGRVGLSPQHLAECFTRDVGQPPHRYLMQVRMERAREMLARSDITVTDLALELGFSSSQHFAAAFKKATGQTAQQHRAAARGSKDDVE